MNPYISGLIVLLLLAAFASGLLCRKKAVEPGIKLMLFVLYFWAIAFIETGLFALGYFLYYR
jgi:uncharacterized protein YqhQ